MDICIILETPVIAMSESNGIGMGRFPGIGGMLAATAHSSLVPVTRQGPRYIEVNGKKRKIRKNGKISRWGPVPKRRRWGGKKEASQLPDELKEVMNSNLNATGTELSLLKIRLQEVTTRLQNPTAYMMSIPENERSPSPQPIYDQKGIRLNTRAHRTRRKLSKARDEILTRILALNPEFKPPADWKRPKIEKRIYVPVDEYPDYNFFGLIIGPGGTTIKRLQKETTTRIAIRGKGSFVEGKANRIPQPDDHEPMNVLITGSTEDNVEKAAKLVQELLVPVTTSENELKAREFRQLALMSGQMISAARCRICGGAGHPVWKCPERSGDRWTPANVQCAICGELSHVTADCKLARPGRKTQSGNVQSLEAEYDSFMKDLTGTTGANNVGPTRPVAAITNSYPPPPSQSWGTQPAFAPQPFGFPAAPQPQYAFPPQTQYAYPPPTGSTNPPQQQQQQQQTQQQYSTT